jgi:ferredoxin-NADP reductase
MTVCHRYPGVSKVVLGYFVCRDVEGVSYLVADFTIQCTDDTWMQYSPAGYIMILVYPLGIYFIRSFSVSLSFNCMSLF